MKLKAMTYTYSVTRGCMGLEQLERFRGVVPALAVPFKGFRIDSELLSEHFERLKKAGVDGFFVVATTGFGHVMGLESKLELVKFAAENKGRAFIIVNVASIEFEEVKELARFSEKVGADAVASNVLYYFRVDAEGAVKYFTKVASLTKLPFFIYNIPQNTGFNVDPDIVRKVKKEAENLAGVKDSSANLIQIAELTSIENLAVFNGADETTLPALIAGAKGYVSALANVAPELFVDLYKSYTSRELGRAVELYRKILQLASILKTMSLNHAVYGALTVIYRRDFQLPDFIRPLRGDEKTKVEKAIELLEK